MSDGRPTRRPVLENRLLKSLSPSIPGTVLKTGSLENKLLTKLSLRSSQLTQRSAALPLRSSILAKYEAKRPGAAGKGAKNVAITEQRDAWNVFYDMWSCPELEEEREMDESYGSEDGIFCDAPPPPPRSAVCDSSASFGGSANRMEGMRLAAPMSMRSRPMAKKVGFAAHSGMFNWSEESWAMPDQGYDFKRVDLGREFDDCDTWPAREERSQRALHHTRTTKLRFLNAVCVSLVSQTNFRDNSDAMRRNLVNQARVVAQHEPEFILKVAVYARQELYLRSTANFLLSLAAWLEPCRPFLRKYYAAAIRLPTDWIEVAELYQVFGDSKLNFGSLPAALRKVMVEKFTDFDEYQLAKYNRAKKKSKKKTTSAAEETPDDDGETEEQRERRSFTIKQLIRLLHVKQPAEFVMSIVGKKYPVDPEAFRRSGLPGQFDSTRCDVRMRLATPETWETQVAQRGNKPEVWRDLIDHKKLPYMAMLRNIRNMIMAGIGACHHDKVLKTLTNETAVRNSKQMAFRYLSAYEALNDLEAMKRKDMMEKESGVEQPKKKASPYTSKEIWWQRKQRVLRACKQQIKYDMHVISQYRSALDRAVAVATVHNVPPIAGRTLLFCDVSHKMDAVCASAKGFGKPKTARTMAVLLSLMCQRSCENCELVCLRGKQAAVRVPLDRRQNLLKQTAQVEKLQQMPGTQRKIGQQADKSDWADECEDLASYTSLSEDTSSEDSSSEDGDTEDMELDAVLDRCIAKKRPVDNIVVMGAGVVSSGVRRLLEVYRRTVNPNLLFVNVDLTSANTGRPTELPSVGDTEEDARNVSLHGFSDQILRFVAERGTSGQLAAVDAIDVKYKLRRDIRLPAVDLKESILAAEAVSSVTRWRAVRVFISSTFLDMHGERDLLIRHVMPELRMRARALRIDLQVVDLRWGITAQQAEEQKQLEMCLSEIDRCQLFIGLLGARYGRPLAVYTVSDHQLAEFTAAQRPGLSLTAMEMLYATRQSQRDVNAAVFYKRDDSFLSSIPGDRIMEFSELQTGRSRLAELRSELESRGCRIRPYKATYGGIMGGRPAATGLQQFGEDLMENMWNTLQTLFPLQASSCDQATEAYTLQHQFAVSQTLVGRRSRLTRAVEEVQRGQGRIILISGKPGSGKTCFLARLYCALESDTGDRLSRLLLPAFCGTGQHCDSPAGLLSYLRALLTRQPLRPPAAGELAQLAAELTELLTVRGRRQHVVLFLDGLESLWQESGVAAVDWLPETVPQNVTIVVGADDGSALCRRVNSLPRVVNVTLGPLELSERSSLVRHLLGHHSKTLDESAWNNQLRTLTSKRGAGDPLYLKLACEELRTFGLFEQVSGKLASMGQTIPALTQDIIQRLEDSYGAEPVRLSLCAVALSQHGMTEDDLLGFLKSRNCLLMVNATPKPLTQFAFSTLLRSAEGLLSRMSAPGQPALLRTAHAEMARVVRSRYMVGAHGDATVRELATWLAEYFEESSELTSPAPPSVVLALPHFWGLAEDMEDYRRVVCSLRYLTLAAESGLTGDLPSLVAAAGVPDSAARRQYLQHPHVTQTNQFLQLNLHLINRNPGLLVQQALNEPADSWLHEAAEQLVRERQLPAGGALVKVTSQQRESVSQPPQCVATLRLDQAVTAVVADTDTDTLVAGLSSGVIKVLELGSGRELRSLTGHAEPITGLILLSDGYYLVSGCAAGQLMVWAVSSGQRLVVKDAHRRRLTGLSPRPDTNEFVSVGWSCDLKLWLFRPGSGLGGGSGGGGAELQQLRVLSRELQPLSCVAHHPSRPLVATGGWDGKLKIWDTTDMNRKAVRHGHSASVRCVAISPDANYIVSGDLDGILIVWGTQHGDVILSWKVHQGAVNAICYLSAQQFATAGADGDVKVWRSHVGAELDHIAADSPIIICVAFREQSTPRALAGCLSFITVTSDGVVSAHRAETTDSQDAALWSRRIQNVTAVACDGKRAYLAVGRTVQVLNLSSGTTQRQMSTDAPVTSLSCLPPCAEDSVHGVVYMGLEDGRVGVGLADRGDVVTSLGHSGQVTCLAVTLGESHPMDFEHKGTPQLASGGRDGVVHVWKSWDGYREPQHTTQAYSAPVSAVGWFNGQLVTAGQNSEVHVYSKSAFDYPKQPEPKTLTGNSSPVCSLATEGMAMMSTATDGQVLVWTSALVAVTEQRCRPGSTGDLGRVNGVMMGLLPQDNGTQLMDLQKLSCVSGFGDHTAGATSVGSSKLGLLSASLDGSCKVWSAADMTVASADAGILAMKLLHVTGARVNSYIATVSRDGQLKVWKWSRTTELPPPLLQYTATIRRVAQEPESLLSAAIGPAKFDDHSQTLSFTAVVGTGCGGCHISVSLPLAPGGGSHQSRWWRHRDVTQAPPLCLAANGYGGAPLLGDADGFVTVMNQELERHTSWKCGAAPEPALAQMCTVGKTVVTCDQNGMVCRVKQTERLNALHVTWEPVLPSSRHATPAVATEIQLDGEIPRWDDIQTGQPTTEPMETEQVATKAAFPTALIATETEAMVGDAGGRVWWRAGQQHHSQQAHAGAVTWLGRDPTRSDVLYSCGADRRLLVWRLSADGNKLQQVGEFEFLSCVHHCALVEAPVADQPTSLLCGDDRGRLHCLHVDLSRVAALTDAPETAPAAAPRTQKM